MVVFRRIFNINFCSRFSLRFVVVSKRCVAINFCQEGYVCLFVCLLASTNTETTWPTLAKFGGRWYMGHARKTH